MEANDSVDVLVRRRLRELRMQRGLTLEDVAQAARIDVSTLSRLESGKRRLALDHLPRLAAALPSVPTSWCGNPWPKTRACAGARTPAMV